jgi:Flp pilus assembly protein TadD
MRWAVAAVVLAALATYANSLLNGFALDDEPIIFANARVHQLADQAAIWLTPYWPDRGSEAGLYRPLSIIAFALQWAAGNGAPWVFHLVSVLLHAGVCLLAFLLVRRIAGATAALVGALVFAVHPIHSEAVANIVGQAELIAAAAVLGGCLIHVARPALRAGVWRTVAISMLFATALLAKESAIVLPGLLLALDFGTRRVHADRAALRTYAQAVLPLFALLLLVSVAWFALRAVVLGSVTGTDPAPYLPFLQDSPGQRLLTALRVWPEYLRLLLWPIDLSADYSPAVIVPPETITAGVLAGALLLLAATAMTLALPWRPRYLAAAWFLIAVLPVSNLIVPIGVILAERTLYLPSLAVAVAAAHLVANSNVSVTAAVRRWAPAGLGLVLLLAAARSAARNPSWKDTSAYWQVLIRDHPESYRAQRGAGELMFARGDMVQARKYLELAWATWPWDADLASGLGALYLRAGEPARAIERMRQARALGDGSEGTQRNLVVAYLAAGQFGDALALADTLAADVAPLRAHALHGLGRYAEAAAEWQAVVTAAPRSWLSWMHLARARARTGDMNGAMKAADTGYGLASDGATRAATDSVRQLITIGCYAPEPPLAGADVTQCPDPIERRGFVVNTGTGNAKGIAASAAVAAQTDVQPGR